MINQEEICVHVISAQTGPEMAADNDPFEIAPFRQTFFRYSIHGQSEVVKSSSFVYASHHSSESSWLEIKKLSVALVGNSDTQNLGLFSPTVRQIYFMGQITYPTSAFNMLPQLNSLKSVVFNIGFGGYLPEFQESNQEFHQSTPEVGGVTSLEIKLNCQLYRSSSDEMKSVFNKMVKSVLKHSADSFPNLNEICVELPNTTLFYHATALLIHGKDFLRNDYQVVKTDEKVRYLLN